LSELADFNYSHQTVNHSIESHLFPRSGTRKTLYPSYFAEYCVRKKFLNGERDQFVKFLNLIQQIYTPSIPTPKVPYRPAVPVVQDQLAAAAPNLDNSLDDFQL
jgi:hypothetical protein